MIQQQSKVCLSALKLTQWQAVSRSISGLLWPCRVKTQTSMLSFSSFPNMAQAENKEKAETVSKKEDTSFEEENVHLGRKTQNDLVASHQDQPLPTSQRKNEKTSSKTSEALGTEDQKVSSDKPSPALKVPSVELEAVMKVHSLSSAIELCSSFNTSQSISALKNLVKARSRPLPLIQKLVESICKSSGGMNIRESSDVLFLLAKLSYINEDALTKSCEVFKLQLKKNKNPAVVGSAISSLRTLQWKDPDLLNELSLWIQENLGKFENPTSFVHTLALQNHIPPNIDELLQIMWKDIKQNRHPPSVLVTFVWSLYSLNSPITNKFGKELLQQFFSKSFLSTIPAGDIPVWIYLWNLHAVAKSVWGIAEFSMPEKVRPELENAVHLVSNAKRQLISEVIQFLFKDVDSNLYASNVPSQMGFPIDLVMSLDDQMNVIPLHLAASKSKKVAVMVHSYRECCQPTREPNGRRTFAMQLLKDQYDVISVPYHLLGSGYLKVHEYFDASLKEVVKNRK